MLSALYEPGKHAFFALEGGRYVSIERDEYPSNPRRFYDNLSTCYTWSRSYFSIDDCPYADAQDFVSDVLGSEVADRLETMQDVLHALREEGYVAKGIYRFEHGDARYAVADENPFNDPWDSGAVGFAFVSPEKLMEEGLEPEDAVGIMEAEMAEYTAWANGDVWSVTLYDESGEDLESGLTIYGLDQIEAEYPNLLPIEVNSADDLCFYAKLQNEWAFHEAGGQVPYARYRRGAVGIVNDGVGDSWRLMNLMSQEASAETFDSPFLALQAYEQYALLDVTLGGIRDSLYKAPERDPRADIFSGKWRVHLVYPGEKYGRNDWCTYEMEEAAKYGMGLPMVEFYDISQDETRFPGGQFVASYFLSTLLGLDGWVPDIREKTSLNLMSDVDAWVVESPDLEVIAKALWEVHEALKPGNDERGLDASVSEAQRTSDSLRGDRGADEESRANKDDRVL